MPDAAGAARDAIPGAWGVGAAQPLKIAKRVEEAVGFGEEVVAVVQPMEWSEATGETAEELTQWMRERLSGVKVPRKIDFLEQLPRMDNGKLYKRHLQDAYRAAT